MLRFGTNGDLSDTTRWHSQVAEIDKLPKFLRVSRRTNYYTPLCAVLESFIIRFTTGQLSRS